MRPYYFDFDAPRTRRAAAIISFEKAARGGWPPRKRHNLDEGLGAVVALLRLWRQRARERQQLARLDARMLRDIGVTPSEAEREIGKPFWRE